MVLVNDNWEKICDLQDISKIIRENYNRDLADELDKLIPKHTDEEYEELECELNYRDIEMSSMEDKIDDLERESEKLKDKIEIQEKIIENFHVDVNEEVEKYKKVLTFMKELEL